MHWSSKLPTDYRCRQCGHCMIISLGGEAGVDGAQFTAFGWCKVNTDTFLLRSTASGDSYFGMIVKYLLTEGANV